MHRREQQQRRGGAAGETVSLPEPPCLAQPALPKTSKGEDGGGAALYATRALTEELHCAGDTNDSATMNIWLHKQVMVMLAENGGKVLEELKH
jgi:Domain of unknown function (DUF3597)